MTMKIHIKTFFLFRGGGGLKNKKTLTCFEGNVFVSVVVLFNHLDVQYTESVKDPKDGAVCPERCYAHHPSPTPVGGYEFSYRGQTLLFGRPVG